MDGVQLGPARETLRRYFGYPDFRPMQKRAVAAVLSGRDAVIVLPTGGGKSICFQVPALLLPGLTVVVSPLISLMADQVQALQRRAVAADYLNSTLTPEETTRRMARLERGETKLLYVAPERLVAGRTTDALRRSTVSLLAVDEAHCVSIWGQDFRPSYARLAGVRASLGDPQTVALTATATPSVREDIVRLLALRSPLEVVGGFDRPNLHFSVRPLRREREREAVLVEELRRDEEPAVVYTATRSQVESVARALRAHRVAAVAYHGGMTAERRAQAQDAFMQGQERVIVATNAFGMGIDKPNVRLVAHHTMSGSLEDYYQEAGRAGRDGADSRCVLLHEPGDRVIHARLRERSCIPPDDLARLWTALRARGGDDVPLDPASFARIVRPTLAAESAERASALLVDAGLLERTPDSGIRQVRLLALPARLGTVRSSLSRHARQLLDRMLEMGVPGHEWRPLEPRTSGLAVSALDRALAELAARQLVHALPPPLTARLTSRPGADGRLDQLLRTLERRQAADRAKLDAMAGYALSPRCRRHFILRYFGDKNAPSRCETCDNCRR